MLFCLGFLSSNPGLSANAADLGAFDDWIADAEQEYGRAGARRVTEWRELLTSDLPEDPQGKLARVNDFFNEVEFVSDTDHWGQVDYWATPVEFLGSGGGDCEDFAIAKYLTLRQLGIPAEQLRITYVKALTLNQAHMVLTWYQDPDAEPLVLDNLDGRIRPASERLDLVPVYSFNGDNLWLAKELSGRGRLVGGADRIGLWRELLERMSTVPEPASGKEEQGEP